MSVITDKRKGVNAFLITLIQTKVQLKKDVALQKKEP